ncbi:MAG: hypothetical protein A3G83_14900 [Betaproteobacteria bacterium RIFCSPLOWO2_12_FULL_68_20]|nr:MAG: hypothetical protein A3G83_14900 [Betaproteobacteria bacterium RIFCSPLOWO2_12_FULL_68_20]
MRRSILALSVAAAFAVPGIAAAQQAAQSPHTLTGNVGLVSDYRFRGIMQTYGKPALQGGVDYSHSSGIYLGNWNSNVNEGAGFPAGNLEMDFYGGFKKSWGDFGIDLGAIYYYYPGSDANAAGGTALAHPTDGRTAHTGSVDNKEIYAGVSWKFLSLKYYYGLDDYFSLPGTKHSNYLDLSANYDLGNGWGISGHVGRFRLKGWHTSGTDLTNGTYTDWKIGVTKDVSGWVFGVAYVDTNAKGSCSAANPGFYCFSNQAPYSAVSTKDAGKATLVLSVNKTF